MWVTELGTPLDLLLAAPPRARGRVVRNRLPVAGARVRFVPASEAWAASTDPAAQLTDETTSADDGTFTLMLPEQRLGEIQVVGADGATARVPMLGGSTQSGDIAVGDVTIPDPRRVVVRLLEAMQAPPCDMIAIGPLGNLGMQTVRASSAVNVYTLDLPESGPWTFTAECGGRMRTVLPTLATIPPPGPDPTVPTIDVRFAR